jgi:ribose 5-phosphate isomerase B
MKRPLVTEQDIAAAGKQGKTSVSITSDTIVTPAARDAALHHKITFVIESASQPPSPAIKAISEHPPKDRRNPLASTRIAIGADHGGYQLKELLRAFLSELGYTVLDVGTDSEQPCDYPDFAYAVAKLVSDHEASKGIIIDGVGVASAIVANKVPGIRAVCCNSEFVARSSREHNDANVLTLGGRVVGAELAKAIVKVWLETWFGGGRHQGRVKKIEDIEARTMKPK